jgi:hypothetical protein
MTTRYYNIIVKSKFNFMLTCRNISKEAMVCLIIANNNEILHNLEHNNF